MANYDRDYVAQVANFIFDDTITAAEVNDQVADVVAAALAAAIKASDALNYVPRPAGFRPGVFWLVSQGVQAFWRSRGPTRIYTMAKNTAKLKWRSAYEMAKLGI